MAKVTFSRADIEALCDRLQARTFSPIVIDMPETLRDLRAAIAVLRWFLEMGVPITPVTLEVFNGTI